MTDTTHLYRHYDSKSTLLYVGVSLNAVVRLSQHKKTSHWFKDLARVEMECFPDRKKALKAERDAIIKEDPVHNIRLKQFKIPEKPQKSRDDLLESVVTFRTMYRLYEAASALCISEPALKRLVDAGEIGSVIIDYRKNRWGVKPVICITGWQMIEYVEHLENESKNAKNREEDRARLGQDS